MQKNYINIAMNRLFLFLIIQLLPGSILLGQDEYIAISKTGPSNAIPGDQITYTITVGNGDQNDWTGTITDELPGEFTFLSSVPVASTVVDQTVTWSDFSVLSGQNRVITVTGYAGRLGSTFGSPHYADGYYMINPNGVTSINNNIDLEQGTSGATLSDSYSTDINQRCEFFLGDLTGQIKMSTSATFRYLIVVQNLGNVWDQFTLYVDPDNPEYASCENPDESTNTTNEVLYNVILDMDDNPLTVTPWIAPGDTYSFYLELTTPPGTSANRWNCTNLDVTSAVCGSTETRTYHTNTINPPSEPNLYLFNIDYPDPVTCEDILNYTIYITNLGRKEAVNTIVTGTYDPFFEFISSDPLPDGAVDNTWSLGPVSINGYAKIDIQGRIRPGVVDQQQILNNVYVSYDDGAAIPEFFEKTIETATTVNAYPDLAVEKLASRSLVKLGDTITYTINYYNLGCGSGTQVIIEDDYDELRSQIIDDGGGTVEEGMLTFNIGTLSPEDGIQTLVYSIVVTDVDCGAAQIVNDVTISSFEPDENVLNNSASSSVLAATAPIWTRFPSDTTVECDNVPAAALIGELAEIWAEDACGRDVNISFLGETITNGICDDTYTLNRSWRAEDEYGNFTERSQVLFVIDTTAPELICPSFSGYITSTDEFGYITVRLEANSGNTYLISNNDFNSTASDNCDGSPVIAYTLSGNSTGSGTELNGVTFNAGATEVIWSTTDQCGNDSTCGYTVIVYADPSITLTKALEDINGESATTTFESVGSNLNYSFRVENTGNMTLYNVTVTDPTATLTGSVIPELAPGEINNTNFSGTYSITQADLDIGYLTNIATVSGTAANTVLISAADTVTVLAIQNGSMTLTKTSTTDPNTYTAVGDLLTYDLLLSNTGNITLYDISVADNLTEETWLIETLSPGTSGLFQTSYQVTQEDLNAGRVVNAATAQGTDSQDDPVTAADDAIINANQLFTLNITKTIDKQDYIYPGDTITYHIILENTGNVNLLDILVEDIISGFTNFIQANQGGNYNVADHTVSWSVSQLDPGEILSLELVVSVADNAEHESVISNMATAESVQTLLVESNSTEILAIHLLELQLAAQNHVNCYGDSTGSILIDVTGGIAPYTFGWQHDPAQTGKEVSNLPIGTYIVNVEDALGNTDEMSVTILQPDGPLNGYLNVPNVQCPGESIGMIELDVNGGTAPYAYLWSNSAITQNIEGLSAGTYSVIITDANGCTWSAEAIIEQSDEAMLIHDIVIDDVVCKDDPEGSISFEISGGTPSYTFLWNNNDTTRSLSGIPGGDYSLIVTDANGCQLLNDFFVDYQYEACEINVPGGLTPNSELDNILLIRGLEKYPNNSLKIFNRYGTMVFDASPYQNDWTGEPDSNYLLVESDGKLPSGTYFYVLVLEPGYEPLTGYIYLIKE